MEIPAPLDPVETLQQQFGDAVEHVSEFRGDTTIVVASESIVDVLLFLRSTTGLVYNYLSDISSVDYYPNDYGDDYTGRGVADNHEHTGRERDALYDEDGRNYPNNYEGSKHYRPERYGVSYHIYSMLYNRTLRVKTFAVEEDPRIPSLTPEWAAANWLEREITDLMGIEFEGHPDARRLLMPDDWDGHPLRRDYPVGKETVAFTFNVEDIRQHKLRARD